MQRIKKVFPYLHQVPFWLLIGVYLFLGIIYIINILPIFKGFIEWQGVAHCSFNSLAPNIPLIPIFCVILYAAFQIKRKNVIYAALFLLAMIYSSISLLMFLPYQAYLLRHKNKISALLLLVLFSILIYFQIWNVDFLGDM